MDIYLITNKINNKIYVGLTSGTTHKRWLKHISDARNLKKRAIGIDGAIRKYGPEYFEVETIETDINSIEELNKREIYWIAELHSNNPKIGYNIVAGGGGTVGYHHTPENKIKCGSSFRGKHRVKASGQVDKWRETCEKNGSLKKSDETKKKHSDQLKLAYKEGRRKPNGKGVGGRGPMTPEEKEANSKNQIGKRDMHHDDYGLNIVAYANEIDDLIKNGWDYKKKKDYYNMPRKEAKEKGII